MDEGFNIRNQSIVIHNGSNMMLGGFSGDDAPKAIFPSIIGYPKCTTPQKDLYVGGEAESKRGILTIKHPIEKGIITNWDDMEKIWYHTFHNKLNVSPNEYRVLLTESPINSGKENKDKMKEIMFETFRVPATFISISSVLSLYSLGHQTGLVLDSGTDITNIIPIFEGEIIQDSIYTSMTGGRNVSNYLQKLLFEKGYSYPSSSAEYEIINDIKEKFGRVSIDYNKEITISNHNENDIEYELPDGQIFTIGNERYTCTESIFQPTLIRSELKGIHELIYNSIINCEFNKRSHLFNNIVLTGGNTMFNGFSSRLTKELESLASPKFKIKVIENLDMKYSPWIGGSILSSLDSFQDKWISKQDYYESG